jgi:hypothetical protein
MTSDIKVGDLVKRMDPSGTGTGILYRVVHIAQPRDHFVLKKTAARYSSRIRVTTSKVKLEPVIVVFESKQVAKRAVVDHFLCELQKVSLVDMCMEYSKIAAIIRDEARALGVEVSGLPKVPDQGNSAHGEPTE